MKKTFRLFVSSTFGDFKKERDVLHKRVFPRVDKYCNKVGFSFQPIDLRWGVSDDASNDQKTLEICLEEVRACKHFPYPNFLIMAGDRYGTIILPYAIEKKDEFDKLKEYISKENYDFIKNWYVLDENQIPESYILQSRKGDSKDNPSYDGVNYTIRDNWKPVNARLLNILQDASQKAFENSEITKKQKEKYFISATEAEVFEGILDYKEETEYQKKLLEDKVIENSKVDKDYVYGYTRTIENASNDYIDKHDDDEKLNYLKKKAQEFKKSLSEILDNEKNLKILKFNSIKDYEDNNLKEFENFIYEKLIDAIDIQKGKIDKTSNLEKEKSEQQKFKNDKLKGFQGRETTLKSIQKYISKEDTNHPLVIHGPSGMGKSSLMAAAIEYRYICDLDLKRIRTIDDKHIIYRFVGATEQTTTIRNLLISICNELNNKEKQSNEYELEEYKFYEQIKNILSNINTPISIFIDALDQLQFKDTLQWLPEELNPNLKIILSVLNDEKYQKDTNYYNILKDRVNKNNLIDITKDSLEDQKNTLITKLLEDLKRKLNLIQEEYFLDRWKQTNYSPLYLKIAIEEVKHWKSDDTDYKLESDVEEVIKEYLENLTKLFHHEEIFVNKVFGYIHASKDGLSEKELLEIISEDLEDEKEFQDQILGEENKDKNKIRQYEPIKVKNPRRENKEELVLPMSLWSRLHSQIKPFLIEKNIDNLPLMKFFHRQFDKVIKNYFAEKIHQKNHARLANYFRYFQEYGDEYTWDKKYNNLRMLSEYPYQLYKTKKYPRILKSILFDLEFAGSIYNNNKQDSFRDIMSKASTLNGITDMEIYPWESFYREKEHLILKVDEELWRPHQSLFQLAYEDGLNSPLSEVANLCVEKEIINWSWFKLKNTKNNYIRNDLFKTIQLAEYIDLNDDSCKLYYLNGELGIKISNFFYKIDSNWKLINNKITLKESDSEELNKKFYKENKKIIDELSEVSWNDISSNYIELNNDKIFYRKLYKHIYSFNKGKKEIHYYIKELVKINEDYFISSSFNNLDTNNNKITLWNKNLENVYEINDFEYHIEDIIVNNNYILISSGSSAKIFQLDYNNRISLKEIKIISLDKKIVSINIFKDKDLYAVLLTKNIIHFYLIKENEDKNKCIPHKINKLVYEDKDSIISTGKFHIYEYTKNQCDLIYKVPDEKELIINFIRLPNNIFIIITINSIIFYRDNKKFNEILYNENFFAINDAKIINNDYLLIISSERIEIYNLLELLISDESKDFFRIEGYARKVSLIDNYLLILKTSEDHSCQNLEFYNFSNRTLRNKIKLPFGYNIECVFNNKLIIDYQIELKKIEKIKLFTIDEILNDELEVKEFDYSYNIKQLVNFDERNVIAHISDSIVILNDIGEIIYTYNLSKSYSKISIKIVNINTILVVQDQKMILLDLKLNEILSCYLITNHELIFRNENYINNEFFIFFENTINEYEIPTKSEKIKKNKKDNLLSDIFDYDKYLLNYDE